MHKPGMDESDRAASRLDFLTIGEVLVDFSQTTLGPQGFPQYEALAGGAPANVAAAMAKWGARSGILGHVGSDVLGRMLADTLRQAGVDCSHLEPCPQPTSLAMVSLSAEGDRSFAFYWKDTSCSALDARLAEPARCRGSRIFHFGSVTLSTTQSRATTFSAVRAARAAGAVISFDANLRPGLWAKGVEEARQPILEALALADIVKLSEEELCFLVGSEGPLHRDDPDVAARMAELRTTAGMGILFVTFGKEGCRWLGEPGTGSVDSLPVEAIDTTGAGDCFMAGLLQCFLTCDRGLQTLTERDCLAMARQGCAAGALSTLKRGGIPSIPPLIEIEAQVSRLNAPSGRT